MKLAGEIERERQERGWTQEQLAHQSGVSLATIGAIERASRERFHPSTLRKLDAVFEWPAGHSKTLTIVEVKSVRSTVDRHSPSGRTPDTAPLADVVVIEGEVMRRSLTLTDTERVTFMVLDNERGRWTIHAVVESDDASEHQAEPGDYVRWLARWEPKD